MNITDESIIGEVVAKDYRTAAVFSSFGIDFCCNGNRTVGNACKEKGIAQSALTTALALAMQEEGNNGIDYQLWPADLLADYIEKRHHKYVEKKTTEIIPYLQKICDVHGAVHPELLEINELFCMAAAELATHMVKEELVLFPFVKKLADAEEAGIRPAAPPFGTVENPIAMMMHEHEAEGGHFRKIAELSNNYTPPADACNTYKVTYALLKEFEADLHLHIHLENNILFPKAIKLEKSMNTL